MKSTKKIIAVVFACAVSFSFMSCDWLLSFATGAKEIIGNPIAEAKFFNCGITHKVNGAGAIDGIDCTMKLDPWTKRLDATLEDGTDYLYASFFYLENPKKLGNKILQPEDYDKGELYLSVWQYWDKERNKWVSPSNSYEYAKTYHDDPSMNARYQYFKAKVNLISRASPVIVAEAIEPKVYEDAQEEFFEYRMSKNAESDDPTGVTEDDIQHEDDDEFKYRKRTLKDFQAALEFHNPDNTWVKYSDFSYWACIDGSWVQLLIFTGDGEMFFYPIEAEEGEETDENGNVNEYDEVYTLGMYSYNRNKKNVRRWIRESYCPRLGALYDELKEKADYAYKIAQVEE